MSSPLAQVQGDFARWVTAREAPAATPGLVSDARAGAAERLGVYRNAYLLRIVAALGDDFPALRSALGAAAFDALAAEYLRAYPSRHPSLRYAGDRLVPFLAEHERAAELRAQAPWAADLARLEHAVTDVFDAADAQPLAREDLAALPPDRWHDLALRALPGVQLLAFAWPVRALRAAHDAGEPLPLAALAPRAERVLVWRRIERVLHREVSDEEAPLLARTIEGVRFGTLCALAAESRAEEAAAYVASALARWVDDGIVGARS